MALRATDKYRLRHPNGICEICGGAAIWSVAIVSDVAMTRRARYCADCFAVRPWNKTDAVPRKESMGACYSKLGHSNNDPISMTPSSIPRWGVKIKAREKSK